jgi:hypothetical protein
VVCVCGGMFVWCVCSLYGVCVCVCVGCVCVWSIIAWRNEFRITYKRPVPKHFTCLQKLSQTLKYIDQGSRNCPRNYLTNTNTDLAQLFLLPAHGKMGGMKRGKTMFVVITNL